MAGVIGIQPYLTNNPESAEQVFCRKLVRAAGGCWPRPPLPVAAIYCGRQRSVCAEPPRGVFSQVNILPIVYFVCCLAQLAGALCLWNPASHAQRSIPTRSRDPSRCRTQHLKQRPLFTASPLHPAVLSAPPPVPPPSSRPAILPLPLRSLILGPRLRAMGLEKPAVDITVRGMRFSTVLNYGLMGKTELDKLEAPPDWESLRRFGSRVGLFYGEAEDIWAPPHHLAAIRREAPTVTAIEEARCAVRLL